MKPMHSFQTSLALSESYSEAPWWSEVYKKAFPFFQSMDRVVGNCWGQMAGIDRIVLIRGGQQFYIDEKVRLKNYPDILLEQWSDVRLKKPGWIQKCLATDFMAYAFIPTATCYLLPFPQLQKAWFKYGREWIKRFGEIEAQNKNYVTVSIPVPIGELQRALSDVQAVKFNNALT